MPEQNKSTDERSDSVEYREFSEKWLDSSAKYIEDGKRAWERYLQAVNEKTSGEYKVEDIQNELLKFVQKEGPEAVKKVMQSSVDYYLSLFNTAYEFNQQMAQALANSRSTGAHVSEAQENITVSAKSVEKASNIDLHFTSIKRRIQKEAFVIVNKKAEDIQVSFEISELICEDGKSKLAAPVSFKPDHFQLKQGAEQVVECRLKLTQSLKPGLEYAALARVVGFQDLFVRIIVIPE